MPAMSRPHLVFVYGTLMTGERYHELLGGSEPAGGASTAPRYRLINLGPYPALVSGGHTAVRGELYRVDDATLERLDHLEDHPELYQRREIELADGRRALAYFFDEAEGREIVSGDWKRR